MKLEFLTVPFSPNQNIAPPDLLAVLFVKLQLSTSPSWAPLFQSSAPPFVPAVLFSKWEFVKLVSVQFSSIVPCKYTAPPRLDALFWMKRELSTIPSDPIQITAPPSPPYEILLNASVAFAIPSALFKVKFEFVILPIFPFQYIPPPDLFATFLSKIQLSTKPLCAPLLQSIAPPFVPAVLLINLEFLNVVLSQLPSALFLRYTAPPLFDALLFMNIQLVTLPFIPDHIIEPPSPQLP